MAEYGDFEPNDLKAATDRIRKRLGGQHHKAAMDAIDNGDIRTAIDISLVYYDKAYNYGLSLRNPLLVSRIEATSTHSAVSARQIVDFVENSNTTSAHE